MTSLPLPNLTCPSCGSMLIPRLSAVKTATNYADCLRNCDRCGIAFSNARTDPTVIHRSPEHNVPEQVREGVLDVLEEALNVRNRPQKLATFGFSTSEDALTWTVFRYLQQTAQLAAVFSELQLVPRRPSCEPTVLIWGVPLPPQSQAGVKLRSRLIAICDGLGESPLSRSEPDIVLDFGEAGLIVIEVKYRSPNEQKPFDAHYTRYLQNTTAFGDIEAVGRSRLYELTRNWRIGVDLAASRPFTLINLVARIEAAKCVAEFCEGLNSERGAFRTVLWGDLLKLFEKPVWLADYLQPRLQPLRAASTPVIQGAN